METSDFLLPSPQSCPQLLGEEGETILLIDAIDDDDQMTGILKKLNHNFSERDRRKKINDLYASLSSLLPAADQTKKLSTQATVSCVLKYIPELQKEVEALVQKKEQLSSEISRQQQEDNVVHHLERQRELVPVINGSTLLAATVSPVGANEVAVQISALIKHNRSLLAEVLQNLEEEGLLLLNASSFESFGEKVFYNLHFQLEENYKVEPEIIRGKILSLCHGQE